MSEISKYQKVLADSLSSKKEEIKKQLQAQYESLLSQFDKSLEELKKTVLNQVRQ